MFELIGPYRPAGLTGTEVSVDSRDDCLFQCLDQSDCTGAYYDSSNTPGTCYLIQQPDSVWQAVEQAGANITAYHLLYCEGKTQTGSGSGENQLREPSTSQPTGCICPHHTI